MHIINAKYQDITSTNREKLALHEIILSQILLIFEDEDVIEDLHMAYLLNQSLVQLYLPQICSYVATSMSETSRRILKEFLLLKCHQNSRFSHVVYWQLMSLVEPYKRTSSIIYSLANKVSAASMLFKHPHNEDTGGTDSYDNRQFFRTIDFVQKLVDISFKLIAVSVNDRKEKLEKMLNDVNEEYLPSKNIHIPLKGQEKRYLYKIYTEYSFPLSTKERVPYQITIGSLKCESSNTSSDEEDEIIEQKLINRSLNRVNLSEVDPDILDSSGAEDHEFFFEKPAKTHSWFSCLTKTTEKPKNHFILRNKPKGLFGETTLKELEENAKEEKPDIQLISLIIKSNDDLKQEQFASQLVYIFKTIFVQSKLDVWVKDFLVFPTCNNGGVIETIDNAISIDRLKKSESNFTNLRDYFINSFGPENSHKYSVAIRNFIESLAGYSLFCYIFQVKDRHNGNILIDDQGHIIHIDFGYMLSKTPGAVSFESAPFKLTNEYLQVMGGQSSLKFLEFKKLMIKGFLAIREHRYKILRFVEICMQTTKLACFEEGDAVLEALNARFAPEMNRNQCKQLMLSLIERSCDN